MLNQFHDILPGTSICSVYDEANQTWQEINQNLDYILDLIASITKQKSIIGVCNYLNWCHSGFISITKPMMDLLQKQLDIPNEILTKCTQLIHKNDVVNYLLWLDQIPSLSNHQFEHRLHDNHLAQPNYTLKIFEYATEIILDNQLLRVTINRHIGAISQIFDHRLKQNLLYAPSTLQFFQDSGQYWDAWNIDPNYEQFPLDFLVINDITIIESGPLRLAVKIVAQFRDSIFEQIIYLNAFSPTITVSNSVHWQEKNVLVKVAFPVNWYGSFATYDIPMGTIDRSTLAETSIEKAKFEVPAQMWANLSDDQQTIGLSIINDCKYGYDAKPHQLRLTLLRGSQWPCPNADSGDHKFIYQIVPHSGNWREANIPHIAYELNNPLSLNQLPETLPLIEVNADNIILSALKPLENDQGYLMRFYETFGVNTDCQFTLKLNHNIYISSIKLCNLLEVPQSDINYSVLTNGAYRFRHEFSPYQIISFLFLLDDNLSN